MRVVVAGGPVGLNPADAPRPVHAVWGAVRQSGGAVGVTATPAASPDTSRVVARVRQTRRALLHPHFFTVSLKTENQSAVRLKWIATTCQTSYISRHWCFENLAKQILPSNVVVP